MGTMFVRIWKTNNRDLVCFARACAIVIKHHSRTDDDLLNIAEVVDSLENGKDVGTHQHLKVVLKHWEITGRQFQDSGTNFYEDPSSVSVRKSIVFQKALAKHGIDLWNFDPAKVWKLEPGIEKSHAPKIDLEKLRNRGARRGQSDGKGTDPKYSPSLTSDLGRMFRRFRATAAMKQRGQFEAPVVACPR